MSTPAGPGPKPQRSHAVLVGVLAGTAAVPLAVIVHPPGMPGYWALVALMAVGLAAGRATYHPARSDPHPRLSGRPAVRAAGWAGLALAAEILWRALLASTAFGALPSASVDGATLGVAALTVIGLIAARRLTEQIHDATGATIGGEIRYPLGASLVGGGIVVLAAAGWTAADPTVPRQMSALLSGSTLAYGLAGLILVHRVRRDGLTTRWQTSRHTLDPQVTANWSTWTILTVAIALVASSVLSLPPASRVRDGFPLFAWLRGRRGEPVIGGRPDGEILYWWFPNDPSAAAGDLNSQTLAVIAAVVVLSGLAAILAGRRARSRTDRRPGHVRSLFMRARHVLRTLLAMLAVMLRSSRQPQQHAPRSNAPGSAPPRPRPPRHQSWRQSEPREQVIRHYKRTLHRAAKHGISRQDWQPPLDYADTLRDHLPTSGPDIDELTELFVTARYSQHPVHAQDARHAKDAYHRLRTELRRAIRTGR